MSIDSYSFCEDGFQARLIQGLLANKPFLRHFFRQYLTSLNDDEMRMFFMEYINTFMELREFHQLNSCMSQETQIPIN